MNLQARSNQKELLDSDAIPFTDISQNMLGLNRINHLLGGHRTTLKGFRFFGLDSDESRKNAPFSYEQINW
ncbi:hypothetical protein [Spirosoma flavus]